MKLSLLVITFAASALAGRNCKCQASDGTGPQYDNATETCCSKEKSCIGPSFYLPDKAHQCTGGDRNCLDSGAFVQCCQAYGAPSAYCWD